MGILFFFAYWARRRTIFLLLIKVGVRLSPRAPQPQSYGTYLSPQNVPKLLAIVGIALTCNPLAPCAGLALQATFPGTENIVENKPFCSRQNCQASDRLYWGNLISGAVMREGGGHYPLISQSQCFRKVREDSSGTHRSWLTT
ncbi:hypothetical protein F5Y06DRAFT_278257 [Hypoxylon sp. FL0890]|nr:hypothetical protein F5Y06DRAFT_278257 [Hypoxylon sp. FL0890]